MTSSGNRPTWDEYFLILAKLAAIRSTCLARQVGAVIVRNKRVLATGYNGPPSGSPHCIDQGYCYPGLANCDLSKIMPSRAIHAEANAIAQAAKHGISTDGASIYVTLEPCLSCLKLIISAGITEVYYETAFNTQENLALRNTFIDECLLTLKPIQLAKESVEKAVLLLGNPTSSLLINIT